MHILIVSQYWRPDHGVPQRRWDWLTRILIDAGHEVTVIAPPPPAQRRRTPDLGRGLLRRTLDQLRCSAGRETGPHGETILRSNALYFTPSLTSRALSQGSAVIYGLLRALPLALGPRHRRPDVIIGTVPAIPTAALTHGLALLLRAPFVIDLRDAWPDLLRNARSWNSGVGRTSLRERLLLAGPMPLAERLFRAGMTATLRRAAAVMVTSEWLGTQMSLTLGTTPVRTIRNVFPASTSYRRPAHCCGADPADLLSLADAGIAPTTSGDTEPLRVLYAGTLGRAQKLDNAIRAALIAQRRGVAIQLVLVGAGASSNHLRDLVDRTHAPVRIHSQVPPEEIERFYRWADTALVHLTDWEPLHRAVPSKTYELMELGIHITGVVAGETATLISALAAGDVAPPEDAEALADLWEGLARDRSRLSVATPVRHSRLPRASTWVVEEREEVAPQQLLTIVDIAAGRGAQAAGRGTRAAGRA